MKFSPLLLGLLLLISSCSILPSPGENSHRYILDKASLATHYSSCESSKKYKQIAIDIPTVYSPLDVNRIVLIYDTNQMDYYANIEWSDKLSTLIRESLIHSLQDAHLFNTITRTADGINPDYVLKLDIRKFNIHKTNCSEDKTISACVEYYATLVNVVTREAVNHTTIHIKIPICEETKEQIIEALNDANKKAIIDLINWLDNQCTRG